MRYAIREASWIQDHFTLVDFVRTIPGVRGFESDRYATLEHYAAGNVLIAQEIVGPAEDALRVEDLELGDVLGFLSCRQILACRTYLLDYVAVRPDMRGTSLAHHLMDRFEYQIAMGDVLLSVRRDNPAAVKFYSRRGYHVVDDDCNGDAFSMQKSWTRD